MAPTAAGAGRAAELRSGIGAQATTSSVQSVAGTDLQAVACPAVTICVAVGLTSKAAQAVAEGANVDGAVVVTITNGVPGPVEVLPEASELYGIVCPTATLCEAVGTRSNGSYLSYVDGPPGLIATITPGAAHQVQSLIKSNSGGLTSVACATSTQCEAVNTSELVTIVNGVPNPPQLLGFPVTAVACGSATTCEAVGSTTSYNNTVDPPSHVGVVPITNGVAGRPLVVPTYFTISGLACSSASLCQAVGSYYYGVDSMTYVPGERGVVLPIVNGVPGEAQLTPGIKELVGIACPSATDCRAVGYQSRGGSQTEALTAPITNGAPDAVEPVTITLPATPPDTNPPNSFKLLSISCPSVATCEAVGYANDTYWPPIGVTVAISPGPPTPLPPTIANFKSPVDGQAAVSTNDAFEWSTVPAAQAYAFTVGTTPGSADLLNSGVLPPSMYGHSVPVMPPGLTLYATIYTKLDGAWRAQTISFTVAPSQASFAAPFTGALSSRIGVDPTTALTWTTIPQAQGYFMVIGTSPFGADVANSGVLPASQLSYTPPILPANATLYATLFTKVNGAFVNGTQTRFQAMTFTTGPIGATFLGPGNGQTGVTGPWFQWTVRAQAQDYLVVIGTTPFGTDVYVSPLLSPDNRALVPPLPKGKSLYAELLTKIHGTWYYDAITFST